MKLKKLIDLIILAIWLLELVQPNLINGENPLSSQTKETLFMADDYFVSSLIYLHY